MDRHLHRELQNGEIILNDCQIPNGRGNIDHIVVASSGVWVIRLNHGCRDDRVQECGRDCEATIASLLIRKIAPTWWTTSTLK